MRDGHVGDVPPFFTVFALYMAKVAGDFDAWNEKKKELEFGYSSSLCVPNVGECWRYYEGVNVGHEQSKHHPFKRLGLVLSTSVGKGLIFVGPLTTSLKNTPYQCSIESAFHYGIKDSAVVLNQCKIIDAQRLSHIYILKKKFSRSFVALLLEKYIAIIKKDYPNG